MSNKPSQSAPHFERFVEGIFLGVICDSLHCLQSEFQKCPQYETSYGLNGNTNCRHILQKVKCVLGATEKCGTAGDYTDFLNILEEMCDEKSELNSKLMEHGECFMRIYSSHYNPVQECVAEFMKAVTDGIAQLQELSLASEEEQHYGRRIIKDALVNICNAIPRAVTCIYTVVKSFCGDEANHVTARIGDSLVHALKKPCEKIIAEQHYTSRTIQSGDLPWLVFISLVSLIIIWY